MISHLLWIFMKITSLAIQTNLILEREFCTIEEKDQYIAVRTPSRPDYFWGNFIIMKNLPSKNSDNEWIKIFEREIGSSDKTGYMAITCDDIECDPNLYRPFKELGFNIMISKVLTAKEIIRPEKFNQNIEVKPIIDSQWHELIDVHFTPDWGYGTDEQQRKFLQDELQSFKKIVEKGIGQRYGAYLEGVLIADLGVYWHEKDVRFNNVSTHRNHRRRGACSTLVYTVSKLMLEKENITTLIMQADEDYHAATIYESIGFSQSQKYIQLEWVDKKKFS